MSLGPLTTPKNARGGKKVEKIMILGRTKHAGNKILRVVCYVPTNPSAVNKCVTVDLRSSMNLR